MPNKPRVYLAGPISGCNDEQRHAWRNQLKRGFSEEFDFIDPTENLISGEGSEHRVVEADVEAIRNSDAVLANMWRESLGTAFGILHAHDAAKIAVVADPNHIGNRMVTYYADAVARTPEGALHQVRVLLASHGTILGVEKHDGQVEAFDRHKLSRSVRKVCLDAGQSDIAPPRAIVPLAVDKLIAAIGETPRTVTSAEVRDAVWEALAELGGEPENDDVYDQIRVAWQRPEGSPAPVAMSVRTIHIADAPLDVRVRSQGTHSTIWGAGVIGKEAKRIFDEIRRIEGITEVVFGPFVDTHAPPSKIHVRIQASKTPTVVDGKCFDKGPRGTMQTFQIRVADPSLRDEVLRVMREHLIQLGHIRSVA